MQDIRGSYRLRGLLCLTLCAASATGLGQAVERPKITGISHAGYFVSDLPKALGFWHDLLGFDEAYDLKGPDGKVQIAFVKINDRQHVELYPAAPADPRNRLSHVCFNVDDVAKMEAYLISQGIALKEKSHKTHTGDLAMEILDPDGTEVEFVQSLPDGLEAKAVGRFEPAGRFGMRIYHVGFLVGNSARSLDFYGKVLGFVETWRGGPDPKELSWINLRVPDGEDYVEFMLYRKLPENYGSANHIALVVPDAPAAVALLKERPAYKTYGREITLRIGTNQKRQTNLFDPDGTRVELMETRTITGQPTPPSNAPPPPAAHD